MKRNDRSILSILAMATQSLLTLSVLFAFVVSTTLACMPAPDHMNDDDVTDGRVEDVDAPPEGQGIQFRQPDLVVQPGEEIQWCWIPDWVPDQDYLVHTFDGFQNGMGHHIIALKSGIPREPGTQFDCTNLEQMTSIRLLVAPENPTTPKIEELGYNTELMPDNFAVRMPAETVIVMQSHYINYGDTPMVVSDVANLWFVPEGEQDAYIEANYFTINHGGINIPQDAMDFTTSAECTVDREVQMISLMGHMHDWGKWITIERTAPGATDETPELLYEIPDWEVDFRDLAPIAQYAENEPLRFMPGDKVKVTCNYDNTSGDDLRFPSEMCVAFGAYFPAPGAEDIICE